MDPVTSQLILGCIAIILGIGLTYWINRRKFYRRNVAGLEGFSSFEASVFVLFMERIGKWFAFGLIILGIFFLWIYSSEKNDEQQQQQEVKTEQSTAINTSSLIGSWEDQSEKALHFTLYADGTAQSDNMATLLYQQWYAKDKQLFLVAKSIGNGHSSIDTIAYSIQKLNDSELTLQRGDLILEYKKVNKHNEAVQNEGNKTLLEQKSKTLKGQLTIGHETSIFKPCGSDKTFWVSDKTGKLKKLYTKLTVGKKPYTPIFTEIEVIDKGKAKEGFPADYESVYEVVTILKTRNISDKDCK